MIVALLNQKGGVGKTTLVLHLAGAWAAPADHDPPVLSSYASANVSLSPTRRAPSASSSTSTRPSRRARDRRVGRRSRSGDAMTARPSNRGFASRPGDPGAWIRAREPSATAQSASDLFTARLTVDVTPELRARIKITAFQRGQTVADMLRDLFAREFPATMADRHEGESRLRGGTALFARRPHGCRADLAREADRTLDQVRPRCRRDDHRPPPPCAELCAEHVFALSAGRRTTLGPSSRASISCALSAGRGLLTSPFVRPGGEILLAHLRLAQGRACLQPRSTRSSNSASIRPTPAPDHWRHVHNRLAPDDEPRPYSRDRHRAWLLRRRVLS